MGSEKKTTNQYLDKELIHEEVKNYVIAYRKAKEDGTVLPRQSESIGKAIINTVQGLSFTYKYKNYPFREDMAAYAILVVCKYIHNYKFEEYKNPHAYISMIADRVFFRYIIQEKTHLATKQKLMCGVDLSAFDTQDFDNDEDFKHAYKEILMANTVVIKPRVNEKKRKAKSAKVIKDPLAQFSGDIA